MKTYCTHTHTPALTCMHACTYIHEEAYTLHSTLTHWFINFACVYFLNIKLYTELVFWILCIEACSFLMSAVPLAFLCTVYRYNTADEETRLVFLSSLLHTVSLRSRESGNLTSFFLCYPSLQSSDKTVD
jgi:hypothetical protein